jgi:hypothetical protein
MAIATLSHRAELKIKAASSSPVPTQLLPDKQPDIPAPCRTSTREGTTNSVEDGISAVVGGIIKEAPISGGIVAGIRAVRGIIGGKSATAIIPQLVNTGVSIFGGGFAGDAAQEGIREVEKRVGVVGNNLPEETNSRAFIEDRICEADRAHLPQSPVRSQPQYGGPAANAFGLY